MSIQLIFRSLEWDNVVLVVHSWSSYEERGSEGWMLERFLPNLCNEILGRVFLVSHKNYVTSQILVHPLVPSLERCKRPWHYNHCSAVTKLSLYYQTCLFSVQFPKPQLDTVKKINSTPAKNSTGGLLGFTCPKGRDFFFPCWDHSVNFN